MFSNKQHHWQGDYHVNIEAISIDHLKYIILYIDSPLHSAHGRQGKAEGS